MEKMETVRMSLNIPVSLVKQVDEYASSMNVNRTSAVCFLLSQSLTSQKAMADIGELMELYRKQVPTQK
jgi:metal-responsive CopG/Arc/MetJ family transcriptional regulator